MQYQHFVWVLLIVLRDVQLSDALALCVIMSLIFDFEYL